MTHFGIICPSSTGHFNPMTTLGSELKQRSHRVTVIGIEDSRNKAIAAGLEFEPIGQTDFPPGATKDLFTQLGQLSGLKAVKYTLQWIANNANSVLQDAPEVIKTAGIEALLVDQAAPEGGTVAEHLNTPFISVCNALMLNRELSVPPFISTWNYDSTWRGLLRNRLGYALLQYLGNPLRKVINRYRISWNLPPHHNQNYFYSSLAQISQQPAEFEFPRQELPKCFHFTGSYSNLNTRPSVAFPYEKLTGQTLVYASLGTLQNRLLWIFEAIAEACSSLDVQLVITLGGGADLESLPTLPGEPIVVGYAPQLELLQKASLTITHAGMNTALESLSNGVPMVAIPITNDQPGVAARIAWTGTGEVVPLKKVSVEKLREAIAKVLEDNSYQQNAARLRGAMDRAGGAIKAADIIEKAVATRKPVLAEIDN